MNASRTSPEDGLDPAAGPPGIRPGDACLARLCAALREWGRLVSQVARKGDPPALEQVIGGLVEWMGNELLDGWLHLPIPLFEAVSGLAEELFQASQAYLGAVRGARGPLPEPERGVHEFRIQSVLDRVDAVKAGVGGQGSGAGG